MVKTLAGAWNKLYLRARDNEGRNGLCGEVSELRALGDISEHHRAVMHATIRRLKSKASHRVWVAVGFKWDITPQGRVQRIEWARRKAEWARRKAIRARKVAKR